VERGDGGSDVAWVESRGAVLDWREEVSSSLFLFFGEVVGCGNDGMMIFR